MLAELRAWFGIPEANDDDVEHAESHAGVGRAMLAAAEERPAADGVEFLQVKTLSPAHPDPGHASTRACYLAYGFRVLEEFPDRWDPANPALQLVKTTAR